MRILVTGGAGFIGSHLVDLLIGEGHEVRVLDSLVSCPHRLVPEYLNPAAEFVAGDLRHPTVVAEALSGVDAVSHQAGRVGLGVDFDDAPDYVSHNDLGTAVLLRELGAQRFHGRLVLASSMVVYGEGRYRCAVHGEVAPGPRDISDLEAGRFEAPCPVCRRPLAAKPIDETARLDPRNVYAATKVHQEHLCAAAAREIGLTVVALRYHNVYGPRLPRDTPYAGVASIFASALAAGRAPQVYEDGGQLRDFVHVRDVARANLAALTAPLSTTVTAFNVASGCPRSILQMAGALRDGHGADAPAPEATGAFRLGDVRHVFASPERATTSLGFAAEEDFAAGMSEVAQLALQAAE